jgi:SAM-dependent methyltransferase
VTKGHFEQAYKDERYFGRRTAVFDQLVKLIDRHAPPRGRVIDIGGAKGHLMAALRAHRPDLEVIVNDISIKACEHAEATYGLRTVPGPLTVLRNLGVTFDLVCLLDVAYYEPDVRALWTVLDSLTGRGSVVIMRIPNTLVLVRVFETFKNLLLSRQRRDLSTHVAFFNPEQVSVFSRRYLQRRSRQGGFASCRFLPSPLTLPPKSSALWADHLYRFAARIAAVSYGRLILTPAQIVVLTK